MNAPSPLFILWGMPGAGKSTAGRYLSRHLGWRVRDLDDAVVARAGLTIPQIFDSGGESAFREWERKVLLDLLASPDADVLVTGGGTPCFQDNALLMRDAGMVVWLDCPVDVLLQHLAAADVVRPLLKAAQTEVEQAALLAAIREQRAACYGLAHVTLRVPDGEDWLPGLAGYLMGLSHTNR